MSEHIERGNQAALEGDKDRALMEYCKALKDPDELVQRIARNRIRELCPDVVYASSHSWGKLYHRPECVAKNAIWNNHKITFRDWKEAESAGYQGCPTCNPPRPTVYLQSQ